VPLSYYDAPGGEVLGHAAVSNEVRRTILRESLTRYRNELLGDEERQLLQDRI